MNIGRTPQNETQESFADDHSWKCSQRDNQPNKLIKAILARLSQVAFHSVQTLNTDWVRSSTFENGVDMACALSTFEKHLQGLEVNSSTIGFVPRRYR